MENLNASKSSNSPSLLSRIKLKLSKKDSNKLNNQKLSTNNVANNLPNHNFMPIIKQKNLHQIIVLPKDKLNLNFQRPLNTNEYKSTPNINTLNNYYSHLSKFIY